MSAATDLAERLLAAGIPVVIFKPGDVPPPGWQRLTADQCDLSGFRPGTDALAMVGGHGIDAVDVDTKDGGSVDHLPPFKFYGVTRTPSGGQHYIVPSSGLGKITPLATPLGHVGDYVGGRPDGSGRLPLFLPGSTRSKYPDGGYVEEEAWDVGACLAADPDPALVEGLENAGGSREQPANAYVDTSPERDPALGPHPYAAAAVAAELGRLDGCTMLGWDGPPWDSTTYEVACNLIEFGNSNWSGFDLDDLHETFLDRAPADEDFGEQHHEAKWSSALNKVSGGGRPRPDSTPEEDFADPVEDEPDPLFDASPVLAHIRQAAHAQMVSAPALLCYVLGRVLVEAEPRVHLPAVIGSRAALNLGVAVVGGSGAGKSALLNVSRDLLGLEGAFQEDIEKPAGSGEGLIMSFLEPRGTGANRENVLIDDPRRILTVDEVDSLGATQGRNGSTIAPTIRTAVSGGHLGQENADVNRRRLVKAGTYRLVLFLGVQPTRSGTLLNDADAGTPQRLVWVRATDPTVPAKSPEWPGPLALPLSPSDIPDTVDYPDHVKTEVRAARLRQVTKQDADPNEGHMLLTRLKVAAAVALLHGDVAITDKWWRVAGLVVADSMTVQEECRRVLSAEVVQQRRSAGRLDAVRLEGAATYRNEREEKAAVAIWRKVSKHAVGRNDGNDQRHEPGDGCTDRCVSRALRDFAEKKEIRDGAVSHAEESGWITNQDGRWHSGDSRPAEPHTGGGR